MISLSKSESNAEVSALIETQTLLQAIINSTHDAISVVNEFGAQILINPAYTGLAGLTEEDVLNHPPTVDIADGSESVHLKVLATQKPINNVRMKIGPNSKEVLVDAAPIFIDGKLKGSVSVINDVTKIMKLTKELEDARRIIGLRLNSKYTFDDIIGSSAAIKYAVNQAKRAAQTPATVLLSGESGTGKELFAHAIHNASERKNNIFIKVNCAALVETLLESELFGYAEGAFTGAKRSGKQGFFEVADGGTIFLDEVGELNNNLQIKLLRVLQEKEIVRVGDTKPISVDVRVIAATNADLEKLIETGKFREDLYYRINMVQITIPPLRDRREDIPLLCDHLIKKLNRDFGRSISGISSSAESSLMEYVWPGNVRELENVLGRAIIDMGPDEIILNASNIRLPETSKQASAEIAEALSAATYLEAFDEWEKTLLSRIMRECGGNKTEAAKKLQISIRNLYYKLQRHNIKI